MNWLLGMALIALASAAAHAGTPRDTVVMAKQIDDIISLDPGESFELSGQEVIGNIYERLLALDPDAPGQLRGQLAESWEVAADGRTHRFRIRPGRRFASGNPVTAEDAAFSLRRAIRLDRSPAVILGQFGITSENCAARIFAADPETLVVVTDARVAPSLLYFSLTATVGSILDAKLVRAHETAGDLGNLWLKRNSAGSGPFMLRSWFANERYTLIANDAYSGNKPAVQRVIVRHIPEPSMQRLLLEKGDVDYARNLTRDQLMALRSNPAIATDTGRKGGILYLALNLKNPYLAHPEVREALKYLVDYAAIEAHIASPGFVVHQSFLPSGFLGAIDATPYAFDLRRARALLAAANLERGFNLTLDTQGISPWTDIAQALQSGFAQAGIKLEILPADLKQILTKYRARKHEVAMLLWEPDYRDPQTNAQAFATNPDNSDAASIKTLAWRNAWDIPEMTRRTEAAAREWDLAARAERYRRLQLEDQAQSPFVIMFQEVEVVAHRSDVEGFVIGPGGTSDSYAGIVKR